MSGLSILFTCSVMIIVIKIIKQVILWQIFISILNNKIPLQSLMFQMKGQYEYATIKMLAAHTKTLYVGATTSGDWYH
jgi:hypothetical protein